MKPASVESPTQTKRQFRLGPRPLAYWLASLAILGVAIYLRFQYLGSIPMWFDEAVYATNSRGSLNDVLQATRGSNSSPLLLPLLLWVIQLFDTSVLAVRLPSAIAGTLAVGVFLLIHRTGVPRVVGLATAAVMATVESQIKYSQEVREYALGVLLVALALYSALEARQKIKGSRGDFRTPVLLSIVAVVAPWTNYGAALGVLAIVIVFIVLSARGAPSRKSLINLSLPLALIAVSGLLSYLVVAQYQTYILGAAHLGALYPPDESFTAQLAWLAFATTNYLTFIFGHIPLAIVAVGSICSWVAVRVALVTQRKNNLRSEGSSHVELAVAAALTSIAGSVLAAFLDVYTFGGARQQLFSAPLLFLATTTTLYFLFTRRKSWAPAVMIVWATVAMLWSNPSDLYTDRDYNDVQTAYSRALERQGERSTPIWVNPDGSYAVSFYYPEEELDVKGFLFDPEELEQAISDTAQGEAILVYGRASLEGIEEVAAELDLMGLTVEQELLKSSGILFVQDTR